MKIINNIKKWNYNLREDIINNKVDPFTEESINKRKKISPFVRNIFKLAVLHYKVKVINKPKINVNEHVIYACNHGYEDDVIINTCYIPTNAYLIMGGTDQTRKNLFIPATLLAGIAFVNVFNKESRKNIVNIGDKILKHTSVQVYMEAKYNDSENRPHEKFFSSPYVWSKNNKVSVIPTINVFDPLKHKTYIMYADPIKGYEMTLDEFQNKLSENITTCMDYIYNKYVYYKKESILNYTSRIMNELFNKELDNNSFKRRTVKINNDAINTVEDYFKFRMNQYAKDDGELGWRENLHSFKDNDICEHSEIIEDLSFNNNSIVPGSYLYYENLYYNLYNFRKFVEKEKSFILEDIRKDKLSILTRNLRKTLKEKDAIILFLIKNFFSLNFSIENELYLYINDLTKDKDIEDTILFITQNILSSIYTKDEILYIIDYNLKDEMNTLFRNKELERIRKN